MDELQTFVGNKCNKLWIWTAVDHFQAGILAWVVGDHNAEAVPALVADRQMLALFLLLLYHGWLEGLYNVH